METIILIEGVAIGAMSAALGLLGYFYRKLGADALGGDEKGSR